MSLRKTENIADLKKKHYISLCGELAVEEAVELSLEGE
jgi:hypothetical protein